MKTKIKIADKNYLDYVNISKTAVPGTIAQRAISIRFDKIQNDKITDNQINVIWKKLKRNGLIVSAGMYSVLTIDGYKNIQTDDR